MIYVPLSLFTKRDRSQRIMHENRDDHKMPVVHFILFFPDGVKQRVDARASATVCFPAQWRAFGDTFGPMVSRALFENCFLFPQGFRRPFEGMRMNELCKKKPSEVRCLFFSTGLSSAFA